MRRLRASRVLRIEQLLEAGVSATKTVDNLPGPVEVLALALERPVPGR
jgi:hypothetical protein